MLNLLSNPLLLVINIVAVLIALTFHEFGHAFVSWKLGDNTPLVEGRVSLDPFRHIDWIGFACLVFFRFGWAKPVAINPSRYKNPRSGSVLVGLAGITMNLILAFLSMLIMYVSQFYLGITTHTFLLFLQVFTAINLSLMVFNLLPIPPLDGYQVLRTLVLSQKNVTFFYFIERYSWYILMAIMLFGIATPIISRGVDLVYMGLARVVLLLLGIA